MLCLTLICFLLVSESRELLYFSTKVFFHSIMSIFFKEVQITGTDNIPRNGPIIFVGNHSNQFVDGIMLMSTVKGHKVSFLVAEKSWNRPVIGHLAFSMGAVPITRPQDRAKKGKGQIRMLKVANAAEGGANRSKSMEVLIEGSDLPSQLNVGDKVRPVGLGDAFKVLKVGADGRNSAVVEVASENANFSCDASKSYDFDIFPHMDQSTAYAKVSTPPSERRSATATLWSFFNSNVSLLLPPLPSNRKVLAKLEKGGTIGIFPEGGSHDRTDLLPLKVGVALIAYAAFEKRGLNIPIVPVGLNYFDQNRFRGRAIIEYGEPIYLDPDTLSDYRAGGDRKKAVCSNLLKNIEDAMRSVIVTAPDYNTLKHVHVVRRLWKTHGISTQEKQDLNRRFSLGLQQLLANYEGQLPEELSNFLGRIKAYQRELEDLGIRDYQVSTLDVGDAKVNENAQSPPRRRPRYVIDLI